MRNEIYFCLHLTSEEHYCVEEEIHQEAGRLGCELVYYRELKTGHVPMYREVKIAGEGPNFNRLKSYVYENYGDFMKEYPGTPDDVNRRILEKWLEEINSAKVSL